MLNPETKRRVPPDPGSEAPPTALRARPSTARPRPLCCSLYPLPAPPRPAPGRMAPPSSPRAPTQPDPAPASCHRPLRSPRLVTSRSRPAKPRPAHRPPAAPTPAALLLTSSNRLLTRTPSFPAPRGRWPPGSRFGPSSSTSSSSRRANCRAPGPRGSWPRCSPRSLRRARRDIGPNGH